MGRLLLIPFLILAVLIAGQPQCPAAAPIASSSAPCSMCEPGGLQGCDRAQGDCCCGQAPSPIPAPTPVRVDGPRISLGLPPEVVAVPPPATRARPIPIPAALPAHRTRPARILYGVWQT